MIGIGDSRSPLLLATAASVIGGTAVAAEWSVTPSGQLYAQVDTNPGLQQQDTATAAAMAAEFALRLQRQTEHFGLVIAPRVHSQRYRRDSALDRDDQSLELLLQQRGEYRDWSGSVRATRDTTATSELGTTGLTQGNRLHQGLNLSLGPSWRFSERYSMTGSVQWLSNRYPDEPQQELVNYQHRSVRLSGGYAYTDRMSLSVNASAGRMTSDLPDSQSDDTHLGLEWNYHWSPLWRAAVSVGPAWAHAASGSRNSVAYRAEFNRQGERSTLSALVNHGVSQSGRGVLTQRDEINFRVTHRLAERMNAAISVSASRNRDAVPTLGLQLNDVRYLRADSSLSWGFAADWSAVLSVGTSMQRLPTNSDAARGHDVRLTLSWSGRTYVD